MVASDTIQRGNGRPEIGERTKSQTVTVSYGADAALSNPLPVAYSTYRTIRKHPTVALARSLRIAPCLASSWSIEVDEAAPDDAEKFVRGQFMGLREHVMTNAMLLGQIDFGWMGFEKVFDVVGGQVVLKKLKPLLHDLTTIQVAGDTGAFAGFKQLRDSAQVPLENSLLIPWGMEGTNWYGEPLLENVRATYTQWGECNDGARRYDKKHAGAHWLVGFPPGVSNLNGTDTDNAEVADTFLKALVSSGSIAYPNHMAELPDDANEFGRWQIELKSDTGGHQHNFVDRLSYLDKLFVRGLLMPERSILEGQFGTKAEAGAHADFAITLIDLDGRYVTRMVNWYCVDQLLALNWGESARGKVRLVQTPLVDDQREAIRAVYEKVLSNPTAFLEEFGTLDTDGIKDMLKIPKRAPDALPPIVPTVTPPAGVDPAGLDTLPGDDTDAAALAARGDLQSAGLNGAQIDSLLSIVEQVATMQISRETGRTLVQISFPMVADDLVTSLFNSISPRAPREGTP